MTDIAVKEPEVSEAEAISEALVPYFPEDGKKSRYLSLRACGFGFRESFQLSGVSMRSVMRWRKEDPEFRRLDLGSATELRTRLGENYLRFEFMRNYRLVLMKDSQVITKSIKKGVPLTDQENAYLLRARQHYTPQQLQILEEIISGSSGAKFDFSEFVLSLSRTTATSREEITVAGRR